MSLRGEEERSCPFLLSKISRWSESAIDKKFDLLRPPTAKSTRPSFTAGRLFGKGLRLKFSEKLVGFRTQNSHNSRALVWLVRLHFELQTSFRGYRVVHLNFTP